MRKAKAVRLARWAGRFKANGARGALARYALGSLAQAGERGEADAVDAVWQLWLDRAEDETWALLERWRAPAAAEHLNRPSLIALGEGLLSDAVFRAALIAASGRSDHPVGDTARSRILAEQDEELTDELCGTALRDPTGPWPAFCVEHGLAPTDPTRRAVFYLLTGQSEQYRAADPDGSLLTLGYTAAGAQERDQIRSAMVRIGGFDLTRVVVGADRRLAKVTPRETGFLTAQLAERREWAQLWRLVQELPLADAVESMRRFDDQWRPGDEEGCALFERLAAAEPDRIRGGVQALSGDTGPIVLEINGKAVAGSFSPDGRRLAVCALAPRGIPPGPYEASVSVFELPSGRRIEQYHYSGNYPNSIVDTGDAIMASNWLRWMLDPELGLGNVERLAGGQKRVAFSIGDDFVDDLIIAGGRLVVLRGEIYDPEYPDSVGDKLLFFTRDGELVSDVPLPGQLGAATLPPGKDEDDPDTEPLHSWDRRISSDPSGGWLAVSGYGMRIVGAHRPYRTVASGPPEFGAKRVHFLDDKRLVVFTAEGQLELWRLHGGLLSRVTAPRSGAAHVGDPEAFAVTSPREFAVLSRGQVHYFNAATLDPVEEPRPLTGMAGEMLWGSRNRECHALAGEGEVHVVRNVPAVREVADRPFADMAPADLATVDAALNSPNSAPDTRPVLELLRACLRHRFGSDVEIGTPRGTGGAHDIALGEDHPR